jgi:hypothetical protein
MALEMVLLNFIKVTIMKLGQCELFNVKPQKTLLLPEVIIIKKRKPCIN